MMRKLLFMVWCLKLADQKPMHPEFTGQYIFASKHVKSTYSKYPSAKQMFGKTKPNDPGITAILTYSIPEEFHFPKYDFDHEMLSKTLTNSLLDSRNPETKFVSDDRVLYHSETNPLFKSKSLNLDDSDDYFSAIGNIRKITRPFESKWIFLPNMKTFVDKRKTPMENFHSLYKTLNKNNLKESPQKTKDNIPDSVFSAPSNLDLKRYTFNNLIGSNIDSISSLRRNGFGDIASGFRDNKFNTLINDRYGPDLSTNLDTSVFDEIKAKTDFNEPSPKNQSYLEYNLQEIKSPRGELHGVMQIVNENGLAEKIHYNEDGIINKTLSSVAPSRKATNSVNLKNATNNIGSTLKNTAKTSKQNNAKSNSTSTNLNKKNAGKTNAKFTTVKPEVKKISLTFESHNVNNGSSPQTEFKNPGIILSDLLNQINTGIQNPPNNVNVRTDVHNTFHETVSESSFSYS